MVKPQGSQKIFHFQKNSGGKQNDKNSRLQKMIETIRKDDPETADKLTKALKAFGASL